MRRRLICAGFVLALAVIQVHAASSILQDYDKCKANGFGLGGSVVCDTEGSLRAGTKQQLVELLNQLKAKVTCNCENGCQRAGNATDEFVGLLLVTNTDKITAGAKPLADSAKTIYDDARLGDEVCDNGLLIVYIEDKQKLATYRGGGNFLLLTDNDMDRLHQIAVKGSGTVKDEAALRYLLTNYDSLVERSDVGRAESWTPFTGLLIAFVVILLILALLAAILLARVCCCCHQRTSKKDKYYVTPVSTYKPTPEPIYIVTPPPPMPEGIYSSPFPSSPLPIAHHHPSTFSAPHSPPGSSRPITPASTHRTAIVRSPTPQAVSRSQSAASKKKNRVAPVTPEVPPHKPAPVPEGESADDLPLVELPFLDPHRARETQTRQDYIV